MGDGGEDEAARGAAEELGEEEEEEEGNEQPNEADNAFIDDDGVEGAGAARQGTLSSSLTLMNLPACSVQSMALDSTSKVFVHGAGEEHD